MPVLSMLTVSGDRLNASINRLAKVGRLPNGDICRLAFTPEILQARYLVQQWMVEAGMTVRTDAAGNIIGRYAGTVEGAPAIATGSHIDTVPSGGKYDGVLGVLAGIEVVRTLRENEIRLNHPIEVIVFTDEENTMIGCQAVAGTAKRSPEQYSLNAECAARYSTIEECLESVGGNWDELETAQRSSRDLVAFVELHVEQGAFLEKTGKEIGVVQGVVGMLRKAISIKGQANHAGTTPMDMRQDALIAAAQIVLAVQEIALSLPSQPVATVGFLTVAPNAVNIVPGGSDGGHARPVAGLPQPNAGAIAARNSDDRHGNRDGNYAKSAAQRRADFGGDRGARHGGSSLPGSRIQPLRHAEPGWT
jgi:beta-ureidopropionase / N-carbamoyl-L-amino-acid hydrolase